MRREDSKAKRGTELPPWLELAIKDLYRGVEEIPGARDNPYIIEAHQRTTLGATDDETPWCSAIMCLWMEKAGLRSTRSAAAASWRNWGRELEYGRVGCVVVMSRPGGNHVCLYLGEDDQGVYVLGGNQDDMVCVRRYPWDRVTNFRWPTAAEGYEETA
ncbi:MAG: TIGR02594 family protein [Syntrophobacterales bacterium]|nr:TIGR02594 family protein [Syntrophobacterales bacterium]